MAIEDITKKRTSKQIADRFLKQQEQTSTDILENLKKKDENKLYSKKIFFLMDNPDATEEEIDKEFARLEKLY